MARKIKFPLDMGNDIKVRDIDELKKNYNSEKIVEYFLSGELLSWLNGRLYDEEAERVEALSVDKDNGNIAGKLAEIFGVQIESGVDVDEIAERNERLSKLREYTSNDDILNNVDSVAFSQEELADLLEGEYKTIYLFGNMFRISLKFTDRNYIGVNNPMVEIKSAVKFDLNNYRITVSNCTFSEETQKMIFDPNNIVEAGLEYLKKNDYENAAKCFKKAAEDGNHEAEFQYGKMLENGTGMEKNKQLARQWYSKAAADGSAKACNNLGNMCKDDEKYDQALAWYKKGIEIEERPTLLYNLGRAYVSKKFNINDHKEAEIYLLKAAEKGFKFAYSDLADLYISYSEVDCPLYDLGKSEYWRIQDLETVSESTDMDLELLADKLFDQTQPAYSAEKALKYYDIALKKKHEEYPNEDCTELNMKRNVCLYRLGKLDETKAISMFKEAADDGEPCSFAVEDIIRYYEKQGNKAMVNKWCKVYIDDCCDGCNDNARYFLIAADCYFDEGNYDKAEAVYFVSTMTDHHPSAHDMIYSSERIGDIYMYYKRGELSAQECRDKARPWYEMALEDCRKYGISEDDPWYIDIDSKYIDACRKR